MIDRQGGKDISKLCKDLSEKVDRFL
jgi:hypothetical protein